MAERGSAVLSRQRARRAQGGCKARSFVHRAVIGPTEARLRRLGRLPRGTAFAKTLLQLRAPVLCGPRRHCGLQPAAAGRRARLCAVSAGVMGGRSLEMRRFRHRKRRLCLRQGVPRLEKVALGCQRQVRAPPRASAARSASAVRPRRAPPARRPRQHRPVRHGSAPPRAAACAASQPPLALRDRIGRLDPARSRRIRPRSGQRRLEGGDAPRPMIVARHGQRLDLLHRLGPGAASLHPPPSAVAWTSSSARQRAKGGVHAGGPPSYASTSPGDRGQKIAARLQRGLCSHGAAVARLGQPPAAPTQARGPPSAAPQQPGDPGLGLVRLRHQRAGGGLTRASGCRTSACGPETRPSGVPRFRSPTRVRAAGVGPQVPDLLAARAVWGTKNSARSGVERRWICRTHSRATARSRPSAMGPNAARGS